MSSLATPIWHEIADARAPELDQLAERYKLHPAHVQSCRAGPQRARVESERSYLFVVLKSLVLGASNKLVVTDLDLFIGSDFVISVHTASLPNFAALHGSGVTPRPDEVLFQLMEGVVDSYLPLMEEIQQRIESLHKNAVVGPDAGMIDQINDIRATLLDLRRVLFNMRHVSFRLEHVHTNLISHELLPFFRDIHDHLAEDLEIIAGELDRLTGLLDTYLSILANRHTEALRTLTFLGTIILPALVISALFGMNIRLPAWLNSSWAFEAIIGFILATSLSLWWYLKRQNGS